MTNRTRPFLLLLAAGLSVAAAACGGGSSAVTGPDVPAAAVAPAVGATIAGTVLGGVTASSPIGASSVSGLRVSVTGTGLQATTDASGRFTLGGVPSGRVELRFEGSGVDARLEVEGLQSGQTLTLTVRVSGSSASKVEDDGGEVELRGKVESVAAGSLVVAGRTVRVDASTRILDQRNLPISLSGLKPGDLVEVEGTAQPDGSLLAAKVKLEDDENEVEVEQEVELRGTITSLGPLTVAGRVVKTDGSTRYLGRKNEPVAAGDVLKLGNTVEVDGVELADKSVLARKIKLED